ncbi:MAG: two component transcriptional regulator, winged helix family protein [uncultured bacterium (gcode 4)]|uniref:Two component transcriptional regulator, winged helix family protein n=1 Tax=uncultured bacterium (gcode 4) TaxID=1234023 RepID=K2FG14_9BACT|nr:MAG: two component transcriptional regulator, winged helix family protein [uncultured bacterium (gcode 4)]
MKILIVEDNFRLRENLIKFFKISNIVAEEAVNGQEALQKTGQTEYDCIILDINMPVMDWKEFLKSLRAQKVDTPVLALTSNSMLDDKVELFNIWADDYLTKPFELEELLVRVKALFRRRSEIIEDKINVKDIEIDILHHKVYKDWKAISLTNKEYLIIEYLSINRWIPKNKTDLLEKVWWEQEETLDLSSVTLEAHISVVRKKLWKDLIKTIKWVGYVIE